MRARLSRLLVVVCLMLAASVATHAQDGISQKKQEKILAKKAKEDKKAKARKEKDDWKRHLSIQDKQTRKRLKKNTKRAGRSGSGPHRDGGLRGLFGRKR
jgi:Ni/Co efflux regulator RcnB